MKTTIILTAAFALVLAATVAVQEPPLTAWQRFELEAPAGKVEVRPFEVRKHVWSEHPYGQYVRPFSMSPPVDLNDPYPPGYDLTVKDAQRILEHERATRSPREVWEEIRHDLRKR